MSFTITVICGLTDLPEGTCAHCQASREPAPLAETRRLALQLMEEHGLISEGWYFEYDRAKTRVGQCSYTSKTISLSRDWTLKLGAEEMRDTILHEIAHALAPGHKHDWYWAQTARSIGCSATRCADLGDEELGDAPWRGTCPTCSATVEGYRSPQRVKACHKCCRGRFNPTHILQWKKHGRTAKMSDKYTREMAHIRTKYGVSA